MRERTMNLKMYSRAFRVRRMGSHCSPRLDTSKYLFSTDISFLEENDIGEKETDRERKRERETKEENITQSREEEKKREKGRKKSKIIQSELSFFSLMSHMLES